jgi:hypothetical protein
METKLSPELIAQVLSMQEANQVAVSTSGYQVNWDSVSEIKGMELEGEANQVYTKDDLAEKEIVASKIKKTPYLKFRKTRPFDCLLGYIKRFIPEEIQKKNILPETFKVYTNSSGRVSSVTF